APRDRVAVLAVAREDVVVRLQRQDASDDGGLLADVEVAVAAIFALVYCSCARSSKRRMSCISRCRPRRKSRFSLVSSRAFGEICLGTGGALTAATFCLFSTRLPAEGALPAVGVGVLDLRLAMWTARPWAAS